MEHEKHNFLNYFILISGSIIIFQFVPLLSVVQPLELSCIGVLQRELLLALMFVIIALSLALVAFASLSLVHHLIPKLKLVKIRLIPLVSGAILIVLGLASINLSGIAVTGMGISIFPLGVEMFSLGTISISVFVDKMGARCLFKNIPNYAFLLFFLSLVPAAFLIAF
jgi:hypothetical protein